jgi:2-C-methyl-D-erythritol 4-phosphate cytidylyltransferase / 2-C-methyl-D-erythritol 2,4-cyclodiphosphate synthase
MSLRNKNAAIIVAAGSGSRMGGDIPKQYRLLNGKPLLWYSYEALSSHHEISDIYVVISAQHKQLALDALPDLPEDRLIYGGDTRRESVYNGLNSVAINGGAEKVLIHDAARPHLSATVIDALLDALKTHQAAVPVLPIVDSLARGRDYMEETIERDGLYRIQTPQAFRFGAILSAHQNWDSTIEATDDARMFMAYNGKVAMVAGDEALAKFTFASDFPEQSAHKESMNMLRVGTGFDVHRLVKGEELWLCGIKIEHEFGLSGHSDADVALHAVTDALFGALAIGDIGDHFPPSDPKWRGASSDQFAAYAMKLATDLGYRLGNVDLTIICEAPKIGPHREAMRERLANILSTDITNISVKATTTEHLGFTGRGEGIAAQAAVSLYK